ncbi:hypothetical protein [Roseiconus nitratireducens]|uniref:hypothetical protein n=1 Tax=Roseiconus nitratireducens TaxID=2605748 RepID=UPI00191C4F8F|nr:hypothetical protein [Roseiconus nitratireducens]
MSIESVAASFDASQSLTGRHRQARDQWLRTAQLISLNIAEGTGKVATKSIKVHDDVGMKARLHRIVTMLTRMAIKFDGVAESGVGNDADFDDEHEHEVGTQVMLEPWAATKRRSHVS